MAKVNLKVYSQDANEVSSIKVSEEVFGLKEINEQVIFDAVMTYLSNKRQATAKTKNRSEVSGGGKKPFRQKGTGRARAGSTRSPIWVGGGKIFTPTGNQNYKIKQNKKEHNLALRSALSLKAKKDLIVLDSLTLEGKTKEIVKLLEGFKVSDKKTLLITSDALVYQAGANLQEVTLRDVKNISVYDLMDNEKLFILKEDITKLEESLK